MLLLSFGCRALSQVRSSTVRIGAFRCFADKRVCNRAGAGLFVSLLRDIAARLFFLLARIDTERNGCGATPSLEKSGKSSSRATLSICAYAILFFLFVKF